MEQPTIKEDTLQLHFLLVLIIVLDWRTVEQGHLISLYNNK
jgi:hypothetical protein